MTVETANFIGELNASYPEANAQKLNGDNHMRMMKAAMKNSFAGFTTTILTAPVESQGADVNKIILTLSGITVTAYPSNALFVFKATHTNTGAVTAALNGLSALPCLNSDGGAFVAGELLSGSVYYFYCDGSNFYNITPANKASKNGATYTGTHDFTSATVVLPAKVDSLNGTAFDLALTGVPTAPTASFGSTGTQVATLDFVNAVAINSSLPGQTEKKGASLDTDGTSASWRKFNTVRYFMSQA